MKRQNSFKVLMATAGVVVLAGAAQAQSPAGMPPGMQQMMQQRGQAGGMPSGAGVGAAADTGAINNTQTTETTTTTTDFATDAESGTLPDTGGSPLLFALAGTLMAGTAFGLRRKLLS